MANAITCARIVCALILILCPTFSGRFYGFYIVGGITDVLDGFIARRSGTESRLGARLDTAADFIFTGVVLVKILRTAAFPTWMLVCVAGIAGIKCANAVGGLIRWKRFLSEHTVMNKICGVLLFGIPLWIDRMPWKIARILLTLICAVTTFAAVQEGHYIREGREIR